MLREHIRTFGVAPDGRLFRNAAGDYIDASAYGITWGRAREAALALDVHALELASAPTTYATLASRSGWPPESTLSSARAEPDKASRSSSATTPSSWLKRGTMRNRLIEESMQRWQAPMSDAEGDLAAPWPGNAPELLVRAGIPVGDIGSKGASRLTV